MIKEKDKRHELGLTLIPLHDANTHLPQPCQMNRKQGERFKKNQQLTLRTSCPVLGSVTLLFFLVTREKPYDS